jgi:hypothetical protein
MLSASNFHHISWTMCIIYEKESPPSEVQFFSRLVDLVVRKGHFGGSHVFALGGECFVGLVAEKFAQVRDLLGN